MYNYILTNLLYLENKYLPASNIGNQTDSFLFGKKNSQNYTPHKADVVKKQWQRNWPRVRADEKKIENVYYFI